MNLNIHSLSFKRSKCFKILLYFALSLILNDLFEIIFNIY